MYFLKNMCAKKVLFCELQKKKRIKKCLFLYDFVKKINKKKKKSCKLVYKKMSSFYDFVTKNQIKKKKKRFSK